MVKLNLDHEKYKFTTENVLERFNIDEQVIPTKGIDLRFYFKESEPYLLVNMVGGLEEYAFESKGSLVFFLQKLSLNSTLMTTLSNETLTAVVNETLEKQSIFNLVVDKNTNQILTVTAFSASLVSWKKIVETVYELFNTLEYKKVLYLTTFGGLGISFNMNDDENADMDILTIQPQSTSHITIYRGIAREEVSLRGYDENEIMAILREKLKVMIAVDPSISKNYSLVRD